MSVSIHEHEAVVAERDELRRELRNARASDVHSCGPDCTRSGCVNRRLREEIAEKDADIERLYKVIDDTWVSHKRIVVSQQIEKQLREAAECLLHLCEIIGAPEGPILDKARQTLALPQDTTALQSMIAKAGEVMRERCAVTAKTYGCAGRTIAETEAAIRAQPNITIDDLKGGA